MASRPARRAERSSGHHLVHRDLSPTNLIIQSGHDDVTVRACDFASSFFGPRLWELAGAELFLFPARPELRAPLRSHFEQVAGDSRAEQTLCLTVCLAFAWLRDKLAHIAAAHNATMLVVHCVCSDDVARQRIAARAASGLPHRSLAEYDRLREIFEVFETRPHLTVDTTDDLTDLPQHVSAAAWAAAPHPPLRG